MAPFASDKQKKFMYMCSSPKGRRKARGKCPPMKVVVEYLKHGRPKKS